MNRAYPDKIVWKNEPSHDTPLDEGNLNLMSDALYEIDGRVVSMGNLEAELQQAVTDSEANATAAQTSADDAEDNALTAEAWAVGTKGGVPVTSGPQFENSSKYWHDQILYDASFFMRTADYVPDTGNSSVKMARNITEHIGGNLLKFAVSNGELVYKLLSGGTEPSTWEGVSSWSVETQAYTGSGGRATITAGAKDSTTGKIITAPVIQNGRTLTFNKPPIVVFVINEATTVSTTTTSATFAVFLQGSYSYMCFRMSNTASVTVGSGVSVWSLDGKTLTFGHTAIASNLSVNREYYKIYAICSSSVIELPE